MSKTIAQFSILFVVLVLAQAVVFNNICLFNVAVPFVFIYVVIKLPVMMSVNWVLTVAFFAGLTVDIFSNTQGMNSLACTLMAMVRRTALHLYFPREDELTTPEPTIASLGIEVYSKYLITLVTFYCAMIFLIEACSFFDPIQLILRIVSSSVLTFILLIGLDSILSQKR